MSKNWGKHQKMFHFLFQIGQKSWKVAKWMNRKDFWQLDNEMGKRRRLNCGIKWFRLPMKRLFLLKFESRIAEKFRYCLSFLKNGPIQASFCLFSSLPNYTIIQDGVIGTRTQGSRMEGADKSTELWWHPGNVNLSQSF